MEQMAAGELKQRLTMSLTAKQFGFMLAEAEYGRVMFRIRVDEPHKQVHGLVHGGVFAALSETARGLARYTPGPRGPRVATLEIKINYLKAVGGGDIAPEARVVRCGHHIAVVD